MTMSEDMKTEQSRADGVSRAEKIGHKIGAFFAYVVAGCIVAIVLALTTKFIGWILF